MIVPDPKYQINDFVTYDGGHDDTFGIVSLYYDIQYGWHYGIKSIYSPIDTRQNVPENELHETSTTIQQPVRKLRDESTPEGKRIWADVDAAAAEATSIGHLFQNLIENPYDEIKQLRAQLTHVYEAVKRLYYAAHWLPDRPIPDAGKLWEAVRDAAGFDHGHAPAPIIPTEEEALDATRSVALDANQMMRETTKIVDDESAWSAVLTWKGAAPTNERRDYEFMVNEKGGALVCLTVERDYIKEGLSLAEAVRGALDAAREAKL